MSRYDNSARAIVVENMRRLLASLPLEKSAVPSAAVQALVEAVSENQLYPTRSDVDTGYVTISVLSLFKKVLADCGVPSNISMEAALLALNYTMQRVPYRVEVFDLPPALPLESTNASNSKHWAERKNYRDKVHLVVRNAIRVQGIKPFAIDWNSRRVNVTLTVLANSNKKRDADNLAPALKVILDGIVRAGIMPDDDHRYVRSTSCVYVTPNTHLAGARTYVTLEESLP